MELKAVNINIEINQQTFKALYDEYFTLCCRYAYAFLNDYEAARDVTSEVFCDIWKQRQQIRITESTKNYLLVSVRRQCKRHADKRDRQDELKQHYDTGSSSTHQPLENLTSKEATEKFNLLLQKLDPVKKEIIDARLLGLSYKEIAALLNITVRKVEYNMNAAIKELQEEAVNMKVSHHEIYMVVSSFMLLLSDQIDLITGF
ncbi:RNA polymerase sigma factor (sigma-70 family) [Chitinophaga skermanii]|uniref:RNA polymerase sigma factor (Sigma-70 family) n=1 Tax=Chitinophaga skermanii TaxID=331697 RepID=A0A327QRF9_9BACT|nr:sigma-70 family RNA polymerase sigma factor [Chitinophaga skermanii]RAJ06618.1 RNA polymerase sigma factor (sigma-70 family) [Chitinophaga skermanii]